VVLGVTATLLSVALTIRNTYSTARNNLENTYQSRDTVIVEYSSKFNDEITLEGFGFASTRTLYLLKSEPTNFTEALITYSMLETFNSYEYYRFHLLPRSKIEFHPCTYKRVPLIIYIIKGMRNFRKWKESQLEYEERIDPIDYCQNANDDQINHNYTVLSEDHYYIIFYNSMGSSSPSIFTIAVAFNVTQVLYNVQPENIESECTVSRGSFLDCYLPIPLNSSYQKALLKIVPNSSQRASITTTVVLQCGFRDWFYAITCLLAAVGVAVFIITVAVFLVALHSYCAKRNKANTSHSGSTHLTERQMAISERRNNSLSLPSSASVLIPSAPVLSDLACDPAPLLTNPEGILMEQPPPSYQSAFEMSEYSPPPYNSGNVPPPY